jgi:hypothetical protein
MLAFRCFCRTKRCGVAARFSHQESCIDCRRSDHYFRRRQQKTELLFVGSRSAGRHRQIGCHERRRVCGPRSPRQPDHERRRHREFQHGNASRWCTFFNRKNPLNGVDPRPPDVGYYDGVRTSRLRMRSDGHASCCVSTSKCANSNIGYRVRHGPVRVPLP